MGLDGITRAIFSKVDSVSVKRTALNPLLWTTGLVTPASLWLATSAGSDPIRWLLLGFAATPLISTTVAYFILMFRDPDRLQSEEYRIQRQVLRYLYKSGGNAELLEVAEIIRLDHPSDRLETGEQQ